MSGKKSSSVSDCSSGLAHARELIAEVVPDARWREIIERMVQIALSDDPVAVEAAQLLMAYAFGIPTPELDGADY